MADRARFEPAVAALLAARRTLVPIADWPAAARPSTMDEGYVIQGMVAERLASPLAGYKVGAASAASQKLIGAGPFAGRIFATECHASPATVSAKAFFMVGVEGEFGFRLNRDLPERAHFTRADIIACVGEMIPIIEICDTRLADWRKSGVNQLVADNSFCGGIVLGTPVVDWKGIDFLTQEASLAIDGVEVGRGTGKLVQGHPLDSVAWLANELARLGIRMRQGQLIATGTCTGLHMAVAGSVVTGGFGPHGEVRINVV